MNRREFIGAGTAFSLYAAARAAEKTTDGGYAEVSWADRVAKRVSVLPPGAVSVRAFAAKCVGCGLCAAACPSKILRSGRLGQVALDFRYGWCRPNCVRCTQVCPTGALTPLTLAEKRNVRVGYAQIRLERCVRKTCGDECHACEKHCPVRAIRIVEGVPVVDTGVCVGCGACEHYCPARPATAIAVCGYERQPRVRPMAEADLVAEMLAALERGASAVVAKNGMIVRELQGRGIAPLLEALKADAAVFRSAVVADKVVGRAAAAIYVVGGARKVAAPLMSEGAAALLKAHGVAVVATRQVPQILNREQSGGCPMDDCLKGLDDPAEMVEALKAKLAAISSHVQG